MASPLLLFTLNGNVDLDFDDFEDIEEHPMAAPALATFGDLFEGFMETSIEEIQNGKISLDDI